MKQTIRRGAFETNSSSFHSVSVCSASDFDKWKKGEAIYYGNEYGGELFTPEEFELKKLITKVYEAEIHTYDDWDEMNGNSFCERTTTPEGEDIVVFGKYGYDG